MTDPRAQAILDYWFGPDYGSAEPETVAARQHKLWFGRDSAVDADIGALFEPLLAQATSGQLDAWTDSAPALLALVILLDQFPRNIYRDTPRAFEFDELARQCCQLMLAMGLDQQLPAIARVFAYLPLEHSEDIDDQHYSVELFGSLAQANQVCDAQRQAFSGFADYARRHRDVIQRFGRFPHRNALLGRPSTAEENSFLQQPGSSF